MVPEGWRFPSTDVKATWNLWHFGHVHEKIRPLRHLTPADLMIKKKKADEVKESDPDDVTEADQLKDADEWVKGPDASVLSKSRGVMSAIAQELVEMKLVQSLREVEKLPAVESAAAFDVAFVQLIEKVKPGLTTRDLGRWVEMKIPTVYDLLCSARGTKQHTRKRKRQGEQQGVAGGDQRRRRRV